MLFALVFFVLPLLVTVAAMIAAVPLFRRWGLLDRPVSTSMHERPMPTMAGIVFGGVFFVFALIGYGIRLSGNGLDAGSFSLFMLWLAAFFILGIIDDLRRFPAFVKLVPYVVIATLISLTGFHFSSIPLPWIGSMPLDSPWDHLLTVLWFLGVINAVNITDGIDGLLGLLSFFYFLSFMLVSLLSGNLFGASISLLLVAVSLGFLIFNAPPARIFMGNTGSHFLGAAIAFAPLIGGGDAAGDLLFMPAAMMITFPFLDLLWSFARRLLVDRNPFRKDKLHLYHIVARITGNPWKTIAFFFVIFSSGLCFCIIGTRFSVTEHLLLFLIYAILLAVLFHLVAKQYFRMHAGAASPDPGMG